MKHTLKRSCMFPALRKSGRAARQASCGEARQASCGEAWGAVRGEARRVCRRQVQRGSILFVAIGAVAVLSILALGTTSSVLQELRLARHVTGANESFYAGMASAEITKIIFSHDETPTTVTLYDLRDREVAFGQKTLRLRFSDEEGLISLDKSPADVLTRLPGIDGDGAVGGNLASADIHYKEEALLVSGVEPQMYAQFAPHVTTFSGGAVNINTAGSVILQALGMSEDLTEKIRDFRAGVDGEEGTSDDGIVMTAGAIVSDLQDYAGISQPEAVLIGNLVAQGRLGASSNFVRVESALVTGSREEESAKVLVHLPTGRVVGWYEE